MGRTRFVAAAAAIIGIVLAVAIPFLPVSVDSTTLRWPQPNTQSVVAPLIGYAPLHYSAAIPCAAIRDLDDGVVVSSVPATAPDAERFGLIARVASSRLTVVVRDISALDVGLDSLTGGDCALAIDSTANRTTVELRGTDTPPTVLDGDHRPQVTGVFSDLTDLGTPGLQATVEVDSRFASSPTPWKLIAMVLAVVATLVALVALHRLDTADGRRSRRFLPQRWWRVTAVDAVVLPALVLWHFVGATTSDDGYQFGMARMSLESGYMANYFRYWGVPETPFGTPYYEVLGLLSNITTASPFVRLPALVAGIVAWLVISREVAPRLGVAVGRSRAALWTGGFMFLAAWLPFNNGLRPEPVVALGVLLTWCSIERGLATRRLLPIAVAIVIAAATLTAGPSGIICFAALFAGGRPLVALVVGRIRERGIVATLAPLLAAGSVMLVAIFADQPLATVLEMRSAHEVGGPNSAWFDEYLRYQWLLQSGPDGSLARRFAVLGMIVCLAVCVFAILRKGGRIPGTAAGPARRIVAITIGAMALLMFTPTKWTHHFGVFAGLTGSVAVLTAMAVGPAVLRSHRNRALFAAVVLFLLAWCFSGDNGWWYPSHLGVPWWDKPPSIGGFAVNKAFFVAAGATAAFAAWLHFREPYLRRARADRWWWRLSPLAIAAAAMVVFEVASLLKGAVAQYPSFSLARSNIAAVAGQPCGLARDVLVETDPNDNVLHAVDGDDATALAAGGATGFDPNGVADDLSADEKSASGTANTVDTDETATESSSPAGTTGGSGTAGINGSTVALPFGLDPARTPVLGSFGSPSGDATLTSGWYALPEADDAGSRGDIIAVAVAGRIRSIDTDGLVSYGQDLEIEYGRTEAGVTPTALGRVTPYDIGPEPSWRNLRVPLDEIPPDADVVRIVAHDHDRNPDQWLAVTPPRVPQTVTLNELVGSDTPVLLDWAVGLQFPCQRPAYYRDGVSEVPRYRILPDHNGAITTNLWQDHNGGGPLGWTQFTVTAETLPSYLDNAWREDWGSIERFTPLDPNAVAAQLDVTRRTRSGLWDPAPVVAGY